MRANIGRWFGSGLWLDTAPPAQYRPTTMDIPETLLGLCVVPVLLGWAFHSGLAVGLRRPAPAVDRAGFLKFALAGFGLLAVEWRLFGAAELVTRFDGRDWSPDPIGDALASFAGGLVVACVIGAIAGLVIGAIAGLARRTASGSTDSKSADVRRQPADSAAPSRSAGARNDSAPVRAGSPAAEGLAASLQESEANALLATVLDASEAADVRLRALSELTDLDDPRVMPSLGVLKQDADPALAAEARRALHRRRSPRPLESHFIRRSPVVLPPEPAGLPRGELERVVGVIIGLLADPAPEIRAAAAGFLGSMRIESARHPLREVLTDPDEAVREASGRALYQLGEVWDVQEIGIGSPIRDPLPS